jgi:hypothetical protein
MEYPHHTLTIKPRLIGTILLVATVILVALSTIGQVFRYFPDSYQIHSPAQEFALDFFIKEFDVNTESNIPTYFNTIILAIAALLLFVIASAKKALKDRFRYGWFALAFFLLYLSIDELAMIHEKLSKPLSGMTDLGGWFHYRWVIAGMVGVIVVGLLFLRFFLHLENRFKVLFLLSGVLYFMGALGGEMVSGRYADVFGTKNFASALLTTGEEALEFSGVSLLIYSLLNYIELHFSELRFVARPAGKISEKDG